MMLKRAIKFVMILLLPALVSRAQVKSIYVSPAGNDHNTGSIANPLKTVSKALLVAATANGRHVNVYLRKGTYYADKTLVLNSADLKASSLTLTAYQNEPVTLSAGRRLTPNWKPYKNGIYQAAVPKGISFERLYINGAVQHLARYPNYNDTSRVYHGTAADAISPQRVKTWASPTGGYLHALHEGEWGSFDYIITGKNADGTLKMEGGWQNNRPAPPSKEYRFVENIFEELDAPGEWYLDREKSLLYFYPVSRADLSAVVEVSNLKNTIELQGSVTRPVANVTISHINFRHNERTFMNTREQLLRSDWSIYRGGAILFNGTQNCKVSDCTFVGLGGNAIMVSNYNKADMFSGNLVAYIGASAVCFIGDPKAVRSPLFRYEESQPYDKIDKTPGPLTQNYPQECVVTDNLFHNLGEIEKQATGVQIEMSASITASHNSIYNTPRAGINIGDGCWGGHVISFNDIFNTVLESGDHGSFNSWGRDRYWAPDRKYMDSIVQAHPELILLDVQKTITINNNRFRCDHGWDIDLDDGSSNYHIYNNLCLNGGIKLREGFYRRVENNILVNNTLHPHVWFLNSGDVFKHNIVMRKYLPIGIRDWGTQIDSNFFTDGAALANAKQNGTDKHSIAGAAKFKDAAKGDFTLAANTGAFNVSFKNIPMDKFGVQKPALKKLALKPVLPKTLIDGSPESKAAPAEFLGGLIRAVKTVAERSAYGLHKTQGVIIISVGKNTLLTKSGLRDNDVIVAADNQEVIGSKELLDIVDANKFKTAINITYYRNQQPYNGILKLK